ncbi:hypothetical protein ACFTZB_25330 [Rhodococcus sp. NPDC057014]|uniref:hypothetical protein n=1 Tax=Rhodococcus sp. NPDC057014 TaxID=3346000 RepID=UPI00363AADA1
MLLDKDGAAATTSLNEVLADLPSPEEFDESVNWTWAAALMQAKSLVRRLPGTGEIAHGPLLLSDSNGYRVRQFGRNTPTVEQKPVAARRSPCGITNHSCRGCQNALIADAAGASARPVSLRNG